MISVSLNVISLFIVIVYICTDQNTSRILLQIIMYDIDLVIFLSFLNNRSETIWFTPYTMTMVCFLIFRFFDTVCIVQEHVWNLIAKTDYFKAAFNHVINP